MEEFGVKEPKAYLAKPLALQLNQNIDKTIWMFYPGN